MADAKLTIHVPPDASASRIADSILALSQLDEASFPSVVAFRTFLAEQGLNNRPEIPVIATGIGVLERDSGEIQLSRTGILLAKVRPEIVYDMLHYLLYSAWLESQPLTFLPSWTYREVCKLYWSSGEVTIDKDYKTRNVAEVNEAARQYFGQYGSFPDPSFSSKSLDGVHRWLEGLQPPVLTGNTFARRTFCVPELMLLAVGFSVRDESDAIDIDILLTRERREAICQVCLLAPEHLDQVLDYTIATYPQIIQAGTSAGYYGRFIRLSKVPTIEDIVR
jgi:hypothetical protein